MEKEILRQIGLNETQAQTYLTLLNYESITPSELAEKLGENRTTIYSVISSLDKMGLIKRLNGQKIAIQAENPSRIKQLLLMRQKKLNDSRKALDTILPDMTAKFRLATDAQINTVDIKNMDDLGLVWDDIVRDNADVFILSCPAAEMNVAFMARLKTELKKYAETGLQAHVLTANKQFFLTSPTQTIRKLKTIFSEDTMLIIYDVSVAVVTFVDKTIAGVIVIDAPFADLMKNLFLSLL